MTSTLISKLQQTGSISEARTVVNNITNQLQIKLNITQLQLEDWESNSLYYTGVAVSTGRLVVLEVNTLTQELFVLREPAEGWIYIGKLSK